jgi:CRP-like cAMP-binding protein
VDWFGRLSNASGLKWTEAGWRSFGHQPTKFDDAMGGEDVGVAFCTRAAIDDGGGMPSKRNMRALSRVFEESEDAADLATAANGKPGELPKRRKVMYPSTCSFAVRTERLLKCSGLASAVYVSGVSAMEPVCMPLGAGDVWRRYGEPQWRFEAVLAACSAFNAVFYCFACLFTRLLFGRVDTCKDEELVHLSDVLRSHLGSLGLWMDVLSMIGAVAECVHLWEEAGDGMPTVAQWVMMFQMGKLWRVLLPELPAQTKAESYLFLRGVVWIFLQLFMFAHFMACALMVVGMLEQNSGGQSWTEQLKPLEVGCAVTYTEAIYFAVISLTSVGYSDMLVTTRERAVNTVFLLLAQLFTAKVCADLTWLTSTHNHWEAQNQAKQAQTWVALRKMEVPWIVAKRVLAFQSYVANVHREDLAQSAFSGLSENLIKELRLCAYRKLVIQAPFLREQTKEVIGTIVGALRDAVYLPADFIVRAGEKGRELFFIRRGTSAVYVGKDPPTWGKSDSVMTYNAGNYFGELAMLTGRPRAAWVMATSYSVCSSLLFSDVENVGKAFPGAFTRMIQSIVDQFELKPSMKWADVARRMHEKLGFETIEEAFEWFVDPSGMQQHVDDEMNAKAFDEALRRLKVPELDRKIFWATIDTDNSGFITMDEFRAQLADTWDSDRERAAEALLAGDVTGRSDSRIIPRSRTADLLSSPKNSNAVGTECDPTPAAQAAAVAAAQLLREVHRELKESRDQARKLTEEVRALQALQEQQAA